MLVLAKWLGFSPSLLLGLAKCLRQWCACFAKRFVVETYLSYWRALLGSSVTYFSLLSILSKKFCKVFTLVSNIHPSRRNLVTLAFLFDLRPVKGFCQVFCFVSNIHPSRRNFVTLVFLFDLHPVEGFCQVFCFVSNIYPSRWNLVTLAFLFDIHPVEGFCQVFFFVSNIHPSRRNLVTLAFLFVVRSVKKTLEGQLIY